MIQETAYHLETPHGATNFVFDDKRILCESIKVNQNAYSALGHVRYANLAIWLGVGGVRRIEGALPGYTVFQALSGEQLLSRDLDAVEPSLDPQEIVTEQRIEHAANQLRIPPEQVRSRYEAMAGDLTFKLSWRP